MRALLYDITEKDGTKKTVASYSEMLEARARGASCVSRLEEVRPKAAPKKHYKKSAKWLAEHGQVAAQQ